MNTAIADANMFKVTYCNEALESSSGPRRES
jgi:hypothetical protein